jgi:hypothetical protein
VSRSLGKMYREERGVSVSRLIATEDRRIGDDEEASRPHDENSLGSGTRFEETTIQRWCNRLSQAHNHKSASEPVCTALSTGFLGHSPTHAINLNFETLETFPKTLV